MSALYSGRHAFKCTFYVLIYNMVSPLSGRSPYNVTDFNSSCKLLSYWYNYERLTSVSPTLELYRRNQLYWRKETDYDV